MKYTTRSSTAGFSFIELMMVVAIVGVIGVIAVPRYANALTRYRADATAHRIVADFKLAQSDAKQTSASRQVAFDSVNNTYQIPGVAALDDDGTNYDVDLTESPYHSKISTVDFGGDAIVIFNGYGSPDTGGSIQITVGSETRTIIINAASGEATIQ